MVKEIINPTNMSTPEGGADNSKVYTEKMHGCIRDYANDFVALQMYYNLGGVTKVHEVMQDYKIKTFEEYLIEKAGLEKYDTLTEEEVKNPVVQYKKRELDKLSVLFNTEGTTMSKERYEELMEKMFEIVDAK